MENRSGSRINFIAPGKRTPVCFIDRSGVLIQINEEFAQLCGEAGNRHARVGDLFHDALPGADNLVWDKIIDGAWQGELTYVTLHWSLPGGDIRLFEVVFAVCDQPIQRAGKLQLVFRDTSELFRTEQKLEQLAGRFQAVLESSVDLGTSIQDPEKVYRATLDKLAGAIDFDTGTIQLLEGDVLRVAAHHGFQNTEILNRLRFPLDDRFPNVRVVRNKRAFALADIRHDFPHFLTDDEEFGSGHIRSWMGVPLLDRGEVWGMVTLDRAEVKPFDSDDIELAGAIANHAGVAISNTRLYGGLQKVTHELHHRIKNNIQLITSMLNIRAENLDKSTREILGDIRMRILTLSAVHESLYETPELNMVVLSKYVDRIIREIDGGYAPAAHGIVISADVDDNLTIHTDDAIPLGMIISELILNGVKHAFPHKLLMDAPDGSAVITVSIRQYSGGLRLEVGDNGCGMPHGTERTGSFGMILIDMLAQQLKAGGQSRHSSKESIFGPGTVWFFDVPTAQQSSA